MQPGSRLGPYEILSRIGAGGMGEVWRARDTRLGREVAIMMELLEGEPIPAIIARADSNGSTRFLPPAAVA